MAGKLTFKIEVFQENTAILPELERKAKDLTEMFNDIIDEWARENPQKFAMAAGHALVGAQIDPTVFWKELSFRYAEQKMRQGYGDSIMVRTGALRESLSNPNSIFRMVEPEQAVFGTPNDPDDVLKMQYNWDTRQTVFLADWDQNMIRQKVSRFFTVEMQSMKQSAAQLDADFAATVG